MTEEKRRGGGEKKKKKRGKGGKKEGKRWKVGGVGLLPSLRGVLRMRNQGGRGRK